MFGSERRALVFSPADVTFLFAGPVTRRWLVQYKLLRTQLPVLFNVLLWTLLLSREHFGASPWLRALSLWVLLTTLSLHRLGASFVRSEVAEHGRAGLRRRAGAVVAARSRIVPGWTRVGRRPGPRGGGSHAGAVTAFDVVSSVVLQPPLRWLLVPFEVMVRPLTAPGTAAWVHAIWPAVGILVIHFIWVIHSDAAFEESAGADVGPCPRERPNDSARKPFFASVRRPLPRILRLAPTGWPAGAILWKNLVSVVRVRPVRGAIVTGIAAGLGSALLSFGAGTALSDLSPWLALTPSVPTR